MVRSRPAALMACAGRRALVGAVLFAAVSSARLVSDAGSQGDGPLSESRLRQCSFEVVMFDTRNLTDVPSFEGVLVPDSYVILTAVLNYAYAKEHGYKFSYIHMEESRKLKKYDVAWHRVFYFAERLRAQQQQEGCTWFLYLDSDAFVREFTTPIHTFLGGLAERYHFSGDVGTIFAQEASLPPAFKSPWHALNAGVYLVHANALSRHLFDVWQGARDDDLELETHWPSEQGVLTELVFPGRYFTALDGPGRPRHARLRKHEDVSGAVAVVNMTEMNSPWGLFVEHAWSGPGAQKRETDYADMLLRIGAAEPARFDQLLGEARDHVVAWAPTEPGEGGGTQ